MKILSGHTSPENAYVVDDYPYGFKLRCTIRYWLEFHAKRGFRFVSQTTNPKRGGWNKPKASTYSRFGGAMFLDDNGHVQWAGLSEYSTATEAKAFQETYGAGVPEAGRAILQKWIAAKTAYEANRNPGDPLSVGLPEARAAILETATTPLTGQTREQKLETIWKRCHADFKGVTDGVRMILTYRDGTVSVPLDSLTDEEIEAKLPKG